MSVKVNISSPLLAFFKNKKAPTTLEVNTIAEVLDTIEHQAKGFKQHVLNRAGVVNKFIKIYVNSRDILELDGLKTALNKGDVVSILQAMSGG